MLCNFKNISSCLIILLLGYTQVIVKSISLLTPADVVKLALRADDHAELLKCLYNRDEKVWFVFFAVQCLVKASVAPCLHRSYYKVKFSLHFISVVNAS